MKCKVCGHYMVRLEDGTLDCGCVVEDERGAAYQGRLYEPYPSLCPECGSDEVEPS